MLRMNGMQGKQRQMTSDLQKQSSGRSLVTDLPWMTAFLTPVLGHVFATVPLGPQDLPAT